MYARNAGLFAVGGLNKYAPIVDKLMRAHDSGSIAAITRKLFYSASARDITFIYSALDVAAYNMGLQQNRILETMKNNICDRIHIDPHELTNSEIIISKYADLYDSIDINELVKWNATFRQYNEIDSVIAKFLRVSALLEIELHKLKLEADKENIPPSLMRL